MNDPQETPWWIRPDLGNDAGTMDWRVPSWHRLDISDDEAELDRYTAARPVAQQRQHVRVFDCDRAIEAMSQLAIQAGETTDMDSIRAAFRDLLHEFS